MAGFAVAFQARKVKINLLHALSVKTDHQRRGNVELFYMAGEADSLLNPKNKLMRPIIELNAVRTARRGELETLLPSSTSRSMSVERRSVVAKTVTGKQRAIIRVTVPVFIGFSCPKTAG